MLHFDNFLVHFSKIILIAVQDEGLRYLEKAFDALTRIGGYDVSSLEFRGSYALIGYPREKKPSYVKQIQRKRGQGPSVISATVPLTKSKFYIYLIVLSDEISRSSSAI